VVPVVTRHGVRSPYHPASLPDGRPALRKRVEPHHELTTPPGVAVDEVVLDAAEHDHRAGIVVERVRTRELFWAPLSRWRRGVPVRRGFGPQRALRWTDLEPLHDDRAQLALF
jgi:hypothetical protein